MTTEQFIVTWTIDYGYRLQPAEGSGGEITPVFAGEGTEAAFGRFFTTEALTKNVGRKIYCRCTGERTEADGTTSFVIREAQLFAQ